MSVNVPLSKPWLGEEEAAAAHRSILTGWVTQGPQVLAFEREWSEMTGALNSCAVSNCTSALHVALMTAGVRPGDEVITVSHSYIATANSIRHCGAMPVFIDIEPDTFNMNPGLIEGAITPKTAAILAVHQMGMPCDMTAILPIARRHGLKVVEDAACAIGSEILLDGRWRKIGSTIGDATCFSLHPRKVITTGDGGMITTPNSEWDAQYRLLRQHGMSLSDRTRHESSRVMFEEYPVLGFNYRMTDPQAAMGREQLKRLPVILERRRELGERYAALLRGVKHPFQPAWARSNQQSYCVRLPEGRDQKTVMQALLDAGIATRRGIMCAHREAACADIPRPHPLVESERAQDTGIILPLFPQMTEVEQDWVIESLHRALGL